MSTQPVGGNVLAINSILTSDSLADDIAMYWERWDNQRAVAKQRWMETTQYVYATSTRETSNVENNWSHSTHVPKLTQISDNLLANYMAALFPHEDWMSWIGHDQDGESKDTREAVEAYLKDKHRQSGFRNDIMTTLSDWILYGNCFARVEFVNDTIEQDGETISVYTGPKIVRISPYDIVFNPLASDFRSSPKIIKTQKSLGQLHREVDSYPDKAYAQEILNKMDDLRSMTLSWSAEDFEKQTQLRFDGYGSMYEYLCSGDVEILEFYGDYYDRHGQNFYKNHVITVVDRCWVIRAEPLNTFDGYPHIYHSPWRNRPDNLWGMGPLDNIVGMQYLIDHLENARADAFDQMLMPTRVVAGDVEEYGIQPGKPGGKYVIPTGDGSVNNLAPDTTVLNADLQIQNKTMEMELYAGAPRQAMGVRTPGEKTAFEVQQLATAASRIFQNKIDWWEQSFLEPVINAEIEEARRNLVGADVVRVMDNSIGVASFISITKQMLASRGKLVPIGARHFSRQNQLAANLESLSNNLAMDELMKQHFPSVKLAKVWAELLDIDNLELVQPYARVAERAELQRRSQSAEDQVAAEAMTPVGPEVNEE